MRTNGALCLPACPLPVQHSALHMPLPCAPLIQPLGAWLSLTCHQITHTKFTCIPRLSSCCRFVTKNKSWSSWLSRSGMSAASLIGRDGKKAGEGEARGTDREKGREGKAWRTGREYVRGGRWIQKTEQPFFVLWIFCFILYNSIQYLWINYIFIYICIYTEKYSAVQHSLILLLLGVLFVQ